MVVTVGLSKAIPPLKAVEIYVYTPNGLSMHEIVDVNSELTKQLQAEFKITAVIGKYTVWVRSMNVLGHSLWSNTHIIA